MSDDEVRALVRAIAAEPEETRHQSQLVLRLDSALKHVGLLGDETKLPELGKLLHEAGLTRPSKQEEGKPLKPWSGRRFLEWLPEDAWRVRCAEEEATMRQMHKEGRSWLADVQVEPEDELILWHPWEPPPIGTVVQRHWDTRRDGTAGPKIVVGAACDTLITWHTHCPSCSCFELSWILGAWTLDEYWYKDGDIKPMNGPRMVDGIVQGHDAPHCLRPSRLLIPLENVRPSLREAYLARNPTAPRVVLT